MRRSQEASEGRCCTWRVGWDWKTFQRENGDKERWGGTHWTQNVGGQSIALWYLLRRGFPRRETKTLPIRILEVKLRRPGLEGFRQSLWWRSLSRAKIRSNMVPGRKRCRGPLNSWPTMSLYWLLPKRDLPSPCWHILYWDFPKSVWGGSPSFPNMIPGNPYHDALPENKDFVCSFSLPSLCANLTVALTQENKPGMLPLDPTYHQSFCVDPSLPAQWSCYSHVQWGGVDPFGLRLCYWRLNCKALTFSLLNSSQGWL